MRSDSAFYIGSTHKVCEDYAVSRDNIIVVSDGCSTSRNTDIGARIICECTKRWMENDVILTMAQNITNIMNVPRECLNVTRLMAFEKNDKIVIETIGDGNIIIKTKDGIMHVLSMNYAKSAPYYMNYIYNENKNKDWENIKR